VSERKIYDGKFPANPMIAGRTADEHQDDSDHSSPSRPTISASHQSRSCRILLSDEKKFEAQCPVAPIEMPDGDKVWDVQDLDKWIDSLKSSKMDDSAESIVARLDYQ
jgi:hypothetical protein